MKEIPTSPDVALAVNLAYVYLFGVAVALLTLDARGPARIGLALLWPFGPLAFIVTITVLLFASLIAFPILGAIVLAGALAAAAVFAEPLGAVRDTPPAGLEARFIGNMAFAISDGTTTLFTDFPYESGYSGYMEYDWREIRSVTPQSLALITHRHRDHWDEALFEKTTWKVIGPKDALGGIPSSRIVRSLPVTPVRTTLTFDSLMIEALPTPHGTLGHYSYLVTWHGRRLYFTGDTDDDGQLLDMTNIDVAFVSPWLYQRTLKRGRGIDARRIVIYHHTARETVPSCTGPCSVPKQGETLRF